MINCHFVIAALAVGVLSAAMVASAADRSSKPDKYWIYVGTYTGPSSKGIHLVEFDADSGLMQYRGVAAETENPTFICFDPATRHLYAANEASGGKVTAYAIAADTGQLTQVSVVSSAGDGPCHISIDPSGRCLMVANYGSGSFVSMPIDASGALTRQGTAIAHIGGSSAAKGRQEGPHGHGIYPEPSGRYAMAVDLGNDSVSAYALNVAAGTLAATPAAVAKSVPGAGPRHLAITSDGSFVYVTNELNNTVDVFSWAAAKPAFTHLQTLTTLPGDFTGHSATAEIALHPDGKTLYISNRGHDSIAIFRVDPATGLLKADGYQSTEGGEPRHFAIDPAGQWMIVGNQKSGNLVLLEILPDGGLKATGRQLPIPTAVCAIFVPR